MSCYVSPFGSGGGIEGPEVLIKSGSSSETIWTAPKDCIVKVLNNNSPKDWTLYDPANNTYTASYHSTQNYYYFTNMDMRYTNYERLIAYDSNQRIFITLIMLKGESLRSSVSSGNSYGCKLIVYYFK